MVYREIYNETYPKLHRRRAPEERLTSREYMAQVTNDLPEQATLGSFGD